MFKTGKKYKISELPSSIDVLGITYTISYHESPTEVDAEKKSSLFGQTDGWDRTIRIYYKDRPLEDIFITLTHEILHIIDDELEMDLFHSMGNAEEKSINLLALALYNIFSRNGWLTFPAKNKL